MKAQLTQKLAESKAAQKTQLESDYKLKLEQEKQIWLAESKATATPLKESTDQPKPSENTAPATPGTPGTPSQKPPQANASLANLTEDDVREMLKSNTTAISIFKANVTKRVTAETQKLKDEHAKVLAEAQQKADGARAQAVMMEGKKSALKINMSENKIKIASGKLEIVQKAAEETPQKPVVEVWEEAKNYKPPPPSTTSTGMNPQSRRA
jgi:nucleoprotein TPR